MRHCIVTNCLKPEKARGVCSGHYQAFAKDGRLTDLPYFPRAIRPPTERFWRRVQHGSVEECWNWLGATDGRGYGQLSGKPSTSSPVKAHRVSYEILHGPVPAGLELDHLCRNRLCVNPNHLEAVPHMINAQRGETGLHMTLAARGRNSCFRGHPYTKENTYVAQRDGARVCRTCKREWQWVRRKRNHSSLP